MFVSVYVACGLERIARRPAFVACGGEDKHAEGHCNEGARRPGSAGELGATL
jgi:hypothetical protein